VKTIELPPRTYLGKDKKTKCVQHRINISDDILKRLGWSQEEQIILNINHKKRIIILEELKTKNQS